jgi:hypothetical protein
MVKVIKQLHEILAIKWKAKIMEKGCYITMKDQIMILLTRLHSMALINFMPNLMLPML